MGRKWTLSKQHGNGWDFVRNALNYFDFFVCLILEAVFVVPPSLEGIEWETAVLGRMPDDSPFSLMSSKKSLLLAISQEIAKEIEKVFEAKLNLETLREKAERPSGTNVPPQATP